MEASSLYKDKGLRAEMCGAQGRFAGAGHQAEVGGIR